MGKATLRRSLKVVAWSSPLLSGRLDLDHLRMMADGRPHDLIANCSSSYHTCETKNIGFWFIPDGKQKFLDSDN